MFVVLGEYIKSWDRTDAIFEQHRDFIAEQVQGGTFLCSGPTTDGGSVMIAYGDDEAALLDILARDPFSVEGYVRFEIKQFTAGLVDPRSSLAG